jgi:molybdopterin synthase catalytic subunit
MAFALLDTPIDVAALRAGLHADEAGGFVCFEGWVRDHNEGRPVRGLGYSSYRALAETEGERIVQEARGRFGIVAAACAHRVGELAVGELAVWVGVSARHRGPAFDACRWIIDEVKARVPIWKNERYADGEGQWLHPQPRA